MPDLPETVHLVKGPGRGESIVVTGRSDEHVQVRVHMTPDDGPIAATATIGGDPGKPIAAHVSTPTGKTIAAQVGATINGGTPVTAVVEGGTRPVSADVTARLAAPVKVDVGLGDLALRNTTITVKINLLLGWLSILKVEITP